MQCPNCSCQNLRDPQDKEEDDSYEAYECTACGCEFRVYQ